MLFRLHLYSPPIKRIQAAEYVCLRKKIAINLKLTKLLAITWKLEPFRHVHSEPEKNLVRGRLEDQLRANADAVSKLHTASFL